MAASSISHRWKYDVFVSFRGEDIRKRFVDHLFKDFMQKGLRAFRDDNQLPKGEEISPQLYKAIEESRFLIVIFSQNYASSSWCLRELVKILECKQSGKPKHEVRIIFYDVKPDVVRKQKGSYAEAFAKYEISYSSKVAEWKKALSMAADLSGWDLQDTAKGYESTFIDSITKEILKTICHAPLDVGENIVTVSEAVEVVDLMLENSCQQVHINPKAFAQMKNLRILKIYHEKDFKQEFELEDFNVKFSGSLEFLSNELRLLHWNGFPFRFLPSSFYPEKIVAIDLSYSNIKHLWTTHKCFIRLKVMKLRHCHMLTSTPDFTEIINLEELILEGCVNLTKLHPSVGKLKRLVVLNMKNCKSLKSFPCKVEIESLKVLSLSGCLKVDKLPEGLGRIKTLVELHIARTAITELPSSVYSLRNLESLSFGQYERIPSRLWSSFSFLLHLPSRQQVPESLELSSLAGLHLLKDLDLSHCNISEVPDSIGGLSHLVDLILAGNNFTRLPGSLSQLSLLHSLDLHGCRNLEVVPELPASTEILYAGDCTSLRGLVERLNPGHIFFSCIFMGFPTSFGNLTIHESQGSMSQPLLLDASPNSNGSRNQLFSLLQYLALCFPCIFTGCPKSYENLTIHESQGSMSQPLLLDASPNTNGSRNQFFFLLQYLALQINNCGIFPAQGDHVFPWLLDIVYYGNRIPQWFTNQSKGNRVKVDLPSDWCYAKLSGYGFCVVFTPKKCYSRADLIIYVNNFDGALLGTYYRRPFMSRTNQVTGKCGSDMICMSYEKVYTMKWKKAEKFVTFSFGESENIEVKEWGVRFVYKEDIEKGFESSMIQDIPTPTQLGGEFQVMTDDADFT